MPGSRWKGGGYLRVHKEVGDLIDWYNIQFYNQGDENYGTCDNLFNKANPEWPETSVFEIAGNGIPLEKLVVGKPGRAKKDATNGFVDPKMLGACAKDAVGKGWRGGFM